MKNRTGCQMFDCTAHWMAFAAAGVMVLACGAGSVCQETRQRPNVLFAIGDDWGWPHAGAYGDPVVKTPTFDRLATQGILFPRAHVIAPTCTASRGGILTGQAAHRLEDGANLWSRLPAKFRCYPDILEESGYIVGSMRKGWGPGSLEGTGRNRNPAGPVFRSFKDFLATVPPDRPFCFWFGSNDPHRPYEKGSGAASGMDLGKIRVPPFLPDTPSEMNNLAGKPETRDIELELKDKLKAWMAKTNDPRVSGDTDFWDRAPYYGGRPRTGM